MEAQNLPNAHLKGTPGAPTGEDQAHWTFRVKGKHAIANVANPPNWDTFLQTEKGVEPFGSPLSPLVGARGFEPPTPRPPVWCANQAALRPEPRHCKQAATRGRTILDSWASASWQLLGTEEKRRIRVWRKANEDAVRSNEDGSLHKLTIFSKPLDQCCIGSTIDVRLADGAIALPGSVQPLPDGHSASWNPDRELRLRGRLFDDWPPRVVNIMLFQPSLRLSARVAFFVTTNDHFSHDDPRRASRACAPMLELWARAKKAR